MNAFITLPRIRTLLPLVAGLALAVLAASPVLGHAELETSDPENKAVLDTPPTVVTLTFTDGLDAGKSSFTLDGPAGEVGTGKPVKDGSKKMALEDLTLEPGDYAIAWTAAAQDGHIERGKLSFTVLEPTPPPATPTPTPTAAPSAEPTPAPTTAPTVAPSPTAVPVASSAPDDGSGAPVASTGDIVLPIVIGLALAGLVGFLVLRRGRAA